MKRFAIIFLIQTCFAIISCAQTAVWKTIHQGNKAFHGKRYETAAEHYNSILKQNAVNTRALYNLGNARLAQGKISAADSLFTRVAANDNNAPIRSQANHNRGFIYQREALSEKNVERKRQLLQQAIACYKQALRDSPAQQPSRYNLALCQKQLKDLNDNQPQQQPQEEPQKQQQQPKAEQSKNNSLTNFARQAERQTRKKLNEAKRQRSLIKNW
mgnify:FL=1